MPKESDLIKALKSNNTKKYLKLQEESGLFEKFPVSERTIYIDGNSFVLKAGVKAPWITALGAGLVRVYDIRRNDAEEVEFGIGNETLPILIYVKSDRFYNEWPQ